MTKSAASSGVKNSVRHRVRAKTGSIRIGNSLAWNSGGRKSARVRCLCKIAYPRLVRYIILFKAESPYEYCALMRARISRVCSYVNAFPASRGDACKLNVETVKIVYLHGDREGFRFRYFRGGPRQLAFVCGESRCRVTLRRDWFMIMHWSHDSSCTTALTSLVTKTGLETGEFTEFCWWVLC